MLVGPSIVWASEYIGSGEVIIATRSGALLGPAIIWAIVVGIALKFWIGLSGARYTVCTGEGMIDMFARIPGPKNWAVWIVLVGMLFAGIVSIGSVATAGGIFLSSIIPINKITGGIIITLIAVIIAGTGEFKWLKITMSFLVLVVILGVFYVCVHVWPTSAELLRGLIPHKPELPQWVMNKEIISNPWEEILPLLGWGAGGFASQVFYSYWVIGAGYGVTTKNKYGSSADLKLLRSLNLTDAKKLRGWLKMVYSDSFVALIIGILVTSGFLIAGAGILGPREIAPEGNQVAIQLSTIFSSQWGKLGGLLFMIGGTAALMSTSMGQLAGWPRLVADAFRICIPAFGRALQWKYQFRIFLGLFFITNVYIISTLGSQPVVLIKFSAVVDGLLFTPFQSILILFAIYFIQPKLFQPDVAKMLKPHWIFAVGLVVAFLFFGYFCVYQIPNLF